MPFVLPVGHSRVRKFGSIRVQFALPSSSADAEIEVRLRKLGRQARNWDVVSSDQRVQSAARSVGARVVRSEDFAVEMLAVLRRGEKNGIVWEEPKVREDEVEMWMKLFRSSSKKKKDET